MTIRDNRDYFRVLLFLLYHYYSVGGPPKLESTLLKGDVYRGLF